MGPRPAATLWPVTWSAPDPPRLHVRTHAIADPGSLLALLPPKDCYVWLRHGDGLVGWGEVVRHKPTSVAEAAEWWSDLAAQVEVTADLDRQTAGAGLMAYGSLQRPDPGRTALQRHLWGWWAERTGVGGGGCRSGPPHR